MPPAPTFPAGRSRSVTLCPSAAAVQTLSEDRDADTDQDPDGEGRDPLDPSRRFELFDVDAGIRSGSHRRPSQIAAYGPLESTATTRAPTATPNASAESVHARSDAYEASHLWTPLPTLPQNRAQSPVKSGRTRACQRKRRLKPGRESFSLIASANTRAAIPASWKDTANRLEPIAGPL
jgi:hypothetical protein